MRVELIIRFVAIGGIDGKHCLILPFIIRTTPAV